MLLSQNHYPIKRGPRSSERLLFVGHGVLDNGGGGVFIRQEVCTSSPGPGLPFRCVLSQQQLCFLWRP